MNSEIRRIGVLRTGKVLAIVYGFLGLIILPLALIGVMGNAAGGGLWC